MSFIDIFQEQNMYSLLEKYWWNVREIRKCYFLFDFYILYNLFVTLKSTFLFASRLRKKNQQFTLKTTIKFQNLGLWVMMKIEFIYFRLDS